MNTQHEALVTADSVTAAVGYLGQVGAGEAVNVAESERQTRYAETRDRMNVALGQIRMGDSNQAAATSFYSDVMAIVRLRALNLGVPFQDVPDIAQDVCLRIHKQISAGRDIESIYAYVSRAATNMIRDYRRRNGQTESDSFESIMGDNSDSDAMSGRLVAVLVTDADTVEQPLFDKYALMTLSEQLAPREFEVIRMRQVEDLSFEQIASRLGIAESSARVRYHRAVASARDKMADTEAWAA